MISGRKVAMDDQLFPRTYPRDGRTPAWPRRFRWLVASFLSLCLVHKAGAYIPSSQTILARTAENNGSIIYAIEQEVAFSGAGEPLILRETWTVDNENSARLEVRGVRDLENHIQFTYIYSGDNRYSMGAEGSEVKPLGPEFIERYHFYRSSEALTRMLIRAQILPPEALRERTRRRENGRTRYSPQDFLRLSRSGGVVTYTFGRPSSAQNLEPSLWVEQDQFLIRRLRLLDGVEVEYSDHGSYARGLRLARSRSIRWNGHQANIQVVRVSTLGRSAATTRQLSPNSLESPKQLTGLEGHPLESKIQEFYSRFR